VPSFACVAQALLPVPVRSIDAGSGDDYHHAVLADC